VIKLPPKLPKCNKNATYFLCSYNTPILLTNKIIVKKKKPHKKNQWANIYLFQKTLFFFFFFFVFISPLVFLYILKIVKFFFYNYFTRSQVNDVAGWGSGCGVRIGEASGAVNMGSNRGVQICEAWV
jgi:hypothetical protein